MTSAGRHALFLVHVDGNAAAVVADGNAAVGMDLHADMVRVTGQRFVDAIVNDLVDHVVQTGPVVGVADIHAGPLANSLQPLQNLDGIGAVSGIFGGVVGHAGISCLLPAKYMLFVRLCHA